MELFGTKNTQNLNNAFTLAEVLITLGIIGIVAALTIPTLVKKYEEKVTITKLQKMYSILSQAYTSSVLEHGTIDTWNAEYTRDKNDDDDTMLQKSQSASLIFYNNFKPYLKISKECGFEKGCFSESGYKKFNNNYAVNFINREDSLKNYMVNLADGSSIAFLMRSTNKSQGVIYFDTNGEKAPNTFGRDLFQFSVTPKKVMPSGIEDYGDEYMNNCYSYGYSCTTWVLTYKNMDYLHCSDLSPDSKTSCK